jgi:hypothetical protein
VKAEALVRRARGPDDLDVEFSSRGRKRVVRAARATSLQSNNVFVHPGDKVAVAGSGKYWRVVWLVDSSGRKFGASATFFR